MPLITSIRPQKNRKKVNVYLDGKFGFSIDNFNLLKFGLKEGQEISQERVADLISKAEGEEVWEKLLKFVSFRQRTEKEIKYWFERKGLPISLYEKYLSKLKRLGLVDDRRFAYSFVQDRLSFNPKPKKILMIELLEKGIPREIANEVLESFDIDEESQARMLIAKHESKWRGLRQPFIQQRKIKFLLGKGYSFDIIRRVVFDEK